MGWTVLRSNPGVGEIFRARPDRPWGLSSLLYNGYQVCFRGVKPTGSGIDHPPSSSAEVKERVRLYLNRPSWPTWSALGLTLPLQNINSSNQGALIEGMVCIYGYLRLLKVYLSNVSVGQFTYRRMFSE